jgi:hypothetical protein
MIIALVVAGWVALSIPMALFVVGAIRRRNTQIPR